MRIFRRADSPYWQMEYSNARGERIRESTKVKCTGKGEALKRSKDLAIRICTEKHTEALRQKHLKEKPTRYWEEAVLRYLETHQLAVKTRSNYISIFSWLDTYLRGRPLHLITKELIEDIARAKENEVRQKKVGQGLEDIEASPATINKVINVIRVILVKAEKEWNWIDKAPFVKNRKDRAARMRWESADTIASILARVPDHQRKPIIFALCTGLRKSNVALHEKVWINRSLRITVIPGKFYKNGKDHIVPLNSIAMQIVNEEWDKHEKYLFTYDSKPIRELNTRAWRTALKEEGVKDFHWHDLRHTWASWMAQNGEQLLTIMQFGGWSDTRMVKRYAHLSPDYLADAASRLSDTKIARLLNEEKDQSG